MIGSVVFKIADFFVQKAAAPQNGAEFRQKSIGVIRYCLATSYDDVRRHAMLPKSSCGGGWCLNGDLVKGFGTDKSNQ